MDCEFQNSTYVHDDVQNIDSFIYIVDRCNKSRLGSFDFFRLQLGEEKNPIILLLRLRKFLSKNLSPYIIISAVHVRNEVVPVHVHVFRLLSSVKRDNDFNYAMFED